jgi:hypothetical protein
MHCRAKEGGLNVSKEEQQVEQEIEDPMEGERCIIPKKKLGAKIS